MEKRETKPKQQASKHIKVVNPHHKSITKNQAVSGSTEQNDATKLAVDQGVESAEQSPGTGSPVKKLGLWRLSGLLRQVLD
ncbi:MAG TPA: hypothetical protein VNX87_04495 [Candidatus Sulfotelmatobacter sp.]|nr:hypothetical protein [Candidatus Sulfotelmatobacter sp.]